MKFIKEQFQIKEDSRKGKKLNIAEEQQSNNDYAQYCKKKSILELKLFKKKYERINDHITGNRKAESKLSPFSGAHRPSVFNENLIDPKMDIP